MCKSPNTAVDPVNRAPLARSSWIGLMIACVLSFVSAVCWLLSHLRADWTPRKTDSLRTALNNGESLPPTRSTSIAAEQVAALEQQIAAEQAADSSASSSVPPAKVLDESKVAIFIVTFAVKQPLSKGTRWHGWNLPGGKHKYNYATHEHTLKLAEIDFLRLQVAWPLLHPAFKMKTEPVSE